jgi:CDP-diacylglycerol--serine O-phosphatidyltransferase
MLAIFEVFQDNDDRACFLILISAVLDFLDGKIAQLANASSDFGMNFDSLSDLVAFGVAPAALMQRSLTLEFGMNEHVAGVTVLFALCGALRLARYNVQASGEESRAFTGLPIPAAAVLLVGLYFLFDSVPYADWLAKLTPIFMILLAYLMVSKIRYPSLKRMVMLRRKSFETLVALVLLCGLLIVLRRHFRVIVAAAACAYLFSGIALQIKQGLSARRQDVSSDPGQVEAEDLDYESEQ